MTKPPQRVYLGDFPLRVYRLRMRNIFCLCKPRSTPCRKAGRKVGHPKAKRVTPAVYVTWDDALAYCDWLSQSPVSLSRCPAKPNGRKRRAGQDAREFPWGDVFEATRCNTRELGLGDTTPVGIFLNGASPYGVLDLSGNVGSGRAVSNQSYPYDRKDKRKSKMRLKSAVPAATIRGTRTATLAMAPPLALATTISGLVRDLPVLSRGEAFAARLRARPTRALIRQMLRPDDRCLRSRHFPRWSI